MDVTPVYQFRQVFRNVKERINNMAELKMLSEQEVAQLYSLFVTADCPTEEELAVFCQFLNTTYFAPSGGFRIENGQLQQQDCPVGVCKLGQASVEELKGVTLYVTFFKGMKSLDLTQFSLKDSQRVLLAMTVLLEIESHDLEVCSLSVAIEPGMAPSETEIPEIQKLFDGIQLFLNKWNTWRPDKMKTLGFDISGMSALQAVNLVLKPQAERLVTIKLTQALSLPGYQAIPEFVMYSKGDGSIVFDYPVTTAELMGCASVFTAAPTLVFPSPEHELYFWNAHFGDQSVSLRHAVCTYKRPTDHRPFTLEISFELPSDAVLASWKKDLANRYVSTPLMVQAPFPRQVDLNCLLPVAFTQMLRDCFSSVSKEALAAQWDVALAHASQLPDTMMKKDALIQFAAKWIHINADLIAMLQDVIQERALMESTPPWVIEITSYVRESLDEFANISMQLGFCDDAEFVPTYSNMSQNYERIGKAKVFFDMVMLIQSHAETPGAERLRQMRERAARAQFVPKPVIHAPVQQRPSAPFPSLQMMELDDDDAQPKREPVYEDLAKLSTCTGDEDDEEIVLSAERYLERAAPKEVRCRTLRPAYHADVLWCDAIVIELPDGQAECVIDAALLHEAGQEESPSQLIFLTPHAKKESELSAPASPYKSVKLADRLVLRAEDGAPVTYVPFSVCGREKDETSHVLFLRNLSGTWRKVELERGVMLSVDYTVDEFPKDSLEKIVYVREDQFYEACRTPLPKLPPLLEGKLGVFMVSTLLGLNLRPDSTDMLYPRFLDAMEHQPRKYLASKLSAAFFQELGLDALTQRATMDVPGISESELSGYGIQFDARSGVITLPLPSAQDLVIAALFCKNNPAIRHVKIMNLDLDRSSLQCRQKIKAFLFLLNNLTGLQELTELTLIQEDQTRWKAISDQTLGKSSMTYDDLVFEAFHACLKAWNPREKCDVYFYVDAFNRTSDNIFMAFHEEISCGRFQIPLLSRTLSLQQQKTVSPFLGYKPYVYTKEESHAELLAGAINEEHNDVSVSFERMAPVSEQVAWLTCFMAQFSDSETTFRYENESNGKIVNSEVTLATILRTPDLFKGFFIIEFSPNEDDVDKKDIHICFKFNETHLLPMVDMTPEYLLELVSQNPSYFWMLSEVEKQALQALVRTSPVSQQLVTYLKNADPEKGLLLFSALMMWSGGLETSFGLFLDALKSEIHDAESPLAKLHAQFVRLHDGYKAIEEACSNSPDKRKRKREIIAWLKPLVSDTNTGRPGSGGVEALTAGEVRQCLYIMDMVPTHPYTRREIEKGLRYANSVVLGGGFQVVKRAKDAMHYPMVIQARVPQIPTVSQCQRLIFNGAENARQILKQVVEIYRDLTALLVYVQGQPIAAGFDHSAALKRANVLVSDLLGRPQLQMGEQLSVVTTYLDLQRIVFGLSMIMDPAANPIALVSARRDAILQNIQAIRHELASKLQEGQEIKADPLIEFLELFTGGFIPDDGSDADPDMIVAAKDFLRDNLGLWLHMVEKYDLNLPTAQVHYREHPVGEQGAHLEGIALNDKSKSFPFSGCHTLSKTTANGVTSLVINDATVMAALHGLQQDREPTGAEKAQGVTRWDTELSGFEMPPKEARPTLLFLTSIGHQAAEFLYNGVHSVEPVIDIQGDHYRPTAFILYHHLGAHFTCVKRVDHMTEQGLVSDWFYCSDATIRHLCTTPQDDLSALFALDVLHKEPIDPSAAPDPKKRPYAGAYIAGVVLEHEAHHSTLDASVPKELPNLGNTCFINTALQALSMTKSPAEHAHALAQVLLISDHFNPQHASEA